MSSSLEFTLNEIEKILKSNGIAEIFDFSPSEWQSHVFYGNNYGFGGQRNRGHLPFITYEFSDDDFTQTSYEGGEHTLNFEAIIHIGKLGFNLDQRQAQIKVREAFGCMIKNIRANEYLDGDDGSIATTDLESLPWGWRQSTTFEVVLSYDRKDFGDFER